MTAAQPIDTARLSLILGDLRLPAIKALWPDFANRADKEGWPAARLIARHHSRNDRRKLSTPRSPQTKARAGASSKSRDNQNIVLIVVPRQSR